MKGRGVEEVRDREGSTLREGREEEEEDREKAKAKKKKIMVKKQEGGKQAKKGSAGEG